MTKVTIELPNELRVPVGKTGKVTVVPLKTYSPKLIQFAVLQGITGALNDVSRGKNDKDQPNSDEVWAALRDKRITAWTQGQWTLSRQGGGSTIVGRMKEAYIVEQCAVHNCAASLIESKIKQTVHQVFGEKETANFTKFLDALATLVSKDRKLDFDDVRQKLETKYTDAAVELMASREKVADKIDLSSIDIDF